MRRKGESHFAIDLLRWDLPLPQRSPLRKLINCKTDSTPVESSLWLIICRLLEWINGLAVISRAFTWSIDKCVLMESSRPRSSDYYRTASLWLNIWLAESQHVFILHDICLAGCCVTRVSAICNLSDVILKLELYESSNILINFFSYNFHQRRYKRYVSLYMYIDFIQ